MYTKGQLVMAEVYPGNKICWTAITVEINFFISNDTCDICVVGNFVLISCDNILTHDLNTKQFKN